MREAFPPGVEVRITDPETGVSLGTEEIGMIEVRGPNVFSGYWRMPEKTAAEFRKDGFFKDQGLDADDYTTPEAVADLLVEHPRLMQRPVLVKGDRAIIGRPKDRVAAFIAG